MLRYEGGGSGPTLGFVGKGVTFDSGGISIKPALNMEEQTLLDGLEIMHEAIRYVNEHGQQEGDSPGWPTGVAGF